jgi:outer membrane lipoprotein-sorting protein
LKSALRIVTLASLVASCASAGAVPPPSTSPPPLALLERVRATYGASPSFTVTFVQSYAPAGFPDATPETGRLVLMAPTLLRFEYDGTEGKLYTFDGTRARQFVAADKQMVVRTLTPEEKGRLPLVFLSSPAELLSRNEAVTRPGPNELTELALVPKRGSEPKQLTLLVTASGEVKKLTILDAEGNRTAFTFTNLTPGPRRPLTDFALVPPKGTRLLTN